MATASDVAERLRQELERIKDAPLVERIRDLLVEPYPVEVGSFRDHLGKVACIATTTIS